MVQLIVFLPLLAAIIAGLGGRWIGPFASKAVTTGALFAGMFLSWPIFVNFLQGDYHGGFVEPVFTWIASGNLTVEWALRVDALNPMRAAGWHILGTARMGTDPGSSVVDPWGKTHDVDNLYVVDGSVFVTSGGVNPTNTISSLALRFAVGIGERRLSQRVPA